MEKEIIRAYRTYENFFTIERTSYQEKIRFYTRNTQDISLLPFEKRVILDYYFVVSYFEVGNYTEFLRRVDNLIETVIENNVLNIETIDPYEELLFKKSASLFNNRKYEEAIFILKQLRRMYPDEKKISHLLYHTYKRKFSVDKINFKAFCVLLYFIAGSVIAAKIFLVDSFYPEFSDTMDIIWLSIFCIASVFIGGNELYIYWKAKRQYI